MYVTATLLLFMSECCHTDDLSPDVAIVGFPPGSVNSKVLGLDIFAVIASFPQQTENQTFCPFLQTWLTTSHCTDYYYVTSMFRLIVTCPCSPRT